jgi:succinate dehydrogenase / fumarate reductase, flavoprotein subunit
MADTPETVAAPVLIIGAGAAGLRAAIELAGRGVDCLVLGKRRHGDAHTGMAAGGINASLGTRDPDDHWTLHLADTLREGHFVCDPRAVELLCTAAPDRVHELRDWGCPFSETPDGAIDQRYFGAQSYRRTCFVGDRTGAAMLAALVERADRVGVPWRENVFITRILVQDERAVGAIGCDLETGRSIVFHASALILAAGGSASIYGRSTSRRDENNGDGCALAWDAGAALRDMEFVQFHPTGMTAPPSARGRLVSEAVRGDGGRLFNESGERFMERYSPRRMELDARDVVTRAIYTEIREGRGTAAGAVLLDASHLGRDVLEERLPGFVEQFRAAGIDVARAPVEVAPTAHYAMGGVAVDFASGASTVAGLYAVGEATGGVHGANRLGGNSLAETVVFGCITGRHVADRVAAARPASPAAELVRAELDRQATLARVPGADDAGAVADELGRMLWDNGGIVRTAAGLRDGLEHLDELGRRAGRAGVDGPAGTGFVRAFNLRFMLRTAEAILRSALEREESRGAHYRADAPEQRDDWQRTVLCSRSADGSMRIWTEPVPALRDELRAAVESAPAVGYHHLE